MAYSWKGEGERRGRYGIGVGMGRGKGWNGINRDGERIKLKCQSSVNNNTHQWISIMDIKSCCFFLLAVFVC